MRAEIFWVELEVPKLNRTSLRFLSVSDELDNSVFSVAYFLCASANFSAKKILILLNSEKKIHEKKFSNFDFRAKNAHL